jgi:hypothetical protein
MQERYFKTKLGNITSSFVRTRASWQEISGDVLKSWGNSTGRCDCGGFDNDAVKGQRSDESHRRFFERQSTGRCSCCRFDNAALMMLWKERDQMSYAERRLVGGLNSS